MIFKKMRFILSILFVSLIVCCSSNFNEASENNLISVDTLLITKYLSKIEEAPLYSLRRQCYLDSLLIMIPQSAFLWQQKAMPLLKQRKYELAKPYLDSAVKYDAINYIDYRAFVKCVFFKSYKDALNDFEIAESLKGNSVVMDHRYSFYRGLCHLQLNALDTAIDYFKQSYEESKKDWGDENFHFLYPFYLGISYFEKEEYQLALDYFEHSLRIYSHFSDALFYSALSHYYIGQNDKAFHILSSVDIEYTFTEGNSIYEPYPYQINKYMLKAWLDMISE
jgi:tetratricopeptide (TPR) repeat protein